MGEFRHRHLDCGYSGITSWAAGRVTVIVGATDNCNRTGSAVLTKTEKNGIRDLRGHRFEDIVTAL
jgi:hypothetical protein